VGGSLDGLPQRPGQQEVGFEAPGGRQKVATTGGFFARIVRTLTAPIVPGLVTRTVILTPGRCVVRDGVSETVLARVLWKLLRGQPPAAQVATKDAPAGRQ
jgi:hypothetical protein